MSFIKVVAVCFLFMLSSNFVKEHSQTSDQNRNVSSVLKNKEEPNGSFDSILSLGFRHKKGKTVVNFLYFSSKYLFAGYLFSTISINATKLVDL